MGFKMFLEKEETKTWSDVTVYLSGALVCVSKAFINTMSNRIAD